MFKNHPSSPNACSGIVMLTGAWRWLPNKSIDFARGVDNAS